MPLAKRVYLIDWIPAYAGMTRFLRHYTTNSSFEKMLLALENRAVILRTRKKKGIIDATPPDKRKKTTLYP